MKEKKKEWDKQRQNEKLCKERNKRNKTKGKRLSDENQLRKKYVRKERMMIIFQKNNF